MARLPSSTRSRSPAALASPQPPGSAETTCCSRGPTSRATCSEQHRTAPNSTRAAPNMSPLPESISGHQFAPAKSREISRAKSSVRNRAKFRVRNRAKFRVAQTGHFIEFRANRTLYRFTQNSDTLLGFFDQVSDCPRRSESVWRRVWPALGSSLNY